MSAVPAIGLPAGFLVQGTRAWDIAWAALAMHSINAGLSEPAVAGNGGECWQYMGVDDRGHCFRHRCHPSTGNREYVRVAKAG